MVIENERTAWREVVMTPDANREDLTHGLEVIETAVSAPLPAYRTTRRRTVSRRGVIWLGQTCNLQCAFCYFRRRVADRAHPEHAFLPLAKAKQICKTLVEVYGNTAVDLEGGEPTIYPAILELIAYCVEIGLHPTLITNALVLADEARCRNFRDAGVRDFKVSLHGLGDVHDRLVGYRGAHERQLRALCNLRRLGIPFRFNTVLTRASVRQLPDIARLAVRSGALCVNWLGYNPHEDQEGQDVRFDLMPSFSELREPLTEALDVLDDAGIESNVRYFPPCMVAERHRKSIYHFQQLFYDHREWDLASWAWTTLQPQREANAELSDPITPTSLAWWVRMNRVLRLLASVPVVGKRVSIKRMVNAAWLRPALYLVQRLLARMPGRARETSKAALYDRVARLHGRIDCDSVFVRACRKCSARCLCSGVYRDYAAQFGTRELRPLEGPRREDPTFFVRHQEKLVETEDEVWALASSLG